MTRSVKRPYDTSARRAQSAETRRRILDTARKLLLADGYRATTLAVIAERASVHVDTIYELVGRKPDILRELIEQAVSHADRALPAEERDYVRAIRAEPDPRRKLALYAAALRRTMERLAPLFKAIREAAPSEPTVAALWHEIAERRAANMRLFVADVAASGGLRPGLDVERGADTVWALNSPEMYLLLVEERGWTPEELEAWLADTWARILLG